MEILFEKEAITFHSDSGGPVVVARFREEFPAYCFEVEVTTGVTLGLLRLYQIRNFTNARFLVPAPASVVTKFEAEITKDPFHKIKDRYRFKSYDDLVSFFDKAEIYHRIKETFLGEGGNRSSKINEIKPTKTHEH